MHANGHLDSYVGYGFKICMEHYVAKPKPSTFPILQSCKERYLKRKEMEKSSAEANRLKLTPQFLELKFIESIASRNTKIFFGEKVPNMVLDQRLLGNFLHQTSFEKSSSTDIDKSDL